MYNVMYICMHTIKHICVFACVCVCVWEFVLYPLREVYVGISKRNTSQLTSARSVISQVMGCSASSFHGYPARCPAHASVAKLLWSGPGPSVKFLKAGSFAEAPSLQLDVSFLRISRKSKCFNHARGIGYPKFVCTRPAAMIDRDRGPGI